MKYLAKFVNLEEDDKDIIVSFAIQDNEIDVRSLILHRMLFLEEMLDENEKGVIVSLEGENLENENTNTLSIIKINNNEINIISKYSKYMIDITKIDKKGKEDILSLLTKQNYDNRFIIENA
ncbi:MAG: hypothetical protein OQK98_00655 [Gammaproteobacteria bacterium]|nr:hypothetical protein [Gammaproteobacteria bacterium]